MKKLVSLMAVLTVVIVVVFIRCSSENSFNVATGTPGLAQGTLFDGNGNPVQQGTIWVPSGGIPKTIGQILLVVDNGVTCPDPTDPVETTTDGEDQVCCTGAQGGFACNCNEGQGSFTVHTQDAAGNPMDDITIQCDGVTITSVTQTAATPTPEPSPSPTP